VADRPRALRAAASARLRAASTAGSSRAGAGGGGGGGGGREKTALMLEFSCLVGAVIVSRALPRERVSAWIGP